MVIQRDGAPPASDSVIYDSVAALYLSLFSRPSILRFSESKRPQALFMLRIQADRPVFSSYVSSSLVHCTSFLQLGLACYEIIYTEKPYVRLNVNCTRVQLKFKSY